MGKTDAKEGRGHMDTEQESLESDEAELVRGHIHE